MSTQLLPLAGRCAFSQCPDPAHWKRGELARCGTDGGTTVTVTQTMGSITQTLALLRAAGPVPSTALFHDDASQIGVAGGRTLPAPYAALTCWGAAVQQGIVS